MSLSSDFQKLSVGGVVTLYELDATNVGADVIRFHGHVNFEDWARIYEWAGVSDRFAGSTEDWAGKSHDVSDTEKEFRRDIIFGGKVYGPTPIQSDGLEVRGDGKASSPSLAIANVLNGNVGGVSALCLQHEDLAGAKLTVISTLAKYLDAANFANGNPEASDEHRKQTWYIEQKTGENAGEVTFELSNPVDLEGVQIPTREITNYCNWAIHGKYRGEECGYIGAAMFTEDGTPTDDPALDKCGGRLSDCRLRFGETAALPFGGFPASAIGDL